MKEIELLRKLGLNEYESKTSMALLRLGPSTVKEINNSCYIPKNKIYDVLHTLISKGIVEVLPTIPKKYLIKSVESFSLLLKRKENDLKILRNNLSSLKKIKINSPPLTSKEATWLVYGHQGFLSKVKDALSKTFKENLILATKLRNDPIILRLTEQAIKRGATIRMLLPVAKYVGIDEWEKIGVKVSYLKDFPKIAFSTFDNKICRVNLEIGSINDPTLWIESQAFIQILKERFELLWKLAKK